MPRATSVLRTWMVSKFCCAAAGAVAASAAMIRRVCDVRIWDLSTGCEITTAPHRRRRPSIIMEVMLMRVEFYKGAEGRLCGWIATLPHRRAFQGSTMAAGQYLPHDLTQFTIERALVRAHQAGLVRTETIVNGHYLAWNRGKETLEASPSAPGSSCPGRLVRRRGW